jgi:glycolate oxidase FAD binding subunit
MGIAEIDRIVSREYIRAGEAADAIDGIIPKLVVAPQNAAEVAGILQLANDLELKVVPRGGATKAAWGNPPLGADVVLETHRLTQVVEHAWGDMTATVQAGCSVAKLQETLAAHGQRLAIDALWPTQATIGGLLATNDTGALRVRYGGLRDQVIGMQVALADGTLARSGGKVVKNVAGYDLPKLMTGALGTLGVVVEATFRLYPLPLATADARMVFPTIDAASKAILAIADSTLAPAAVQLALGSDVPVTLDVRFEGVEAALATQISQLGNVSGIIPTLPDSSPWQAREELWQQINTTAIAKVSLLITDLPQITQTIAQICTKLRMQWQLVTYAHGVGTLRLDGANDETLLTAISSIRQALSTLEASLSILVCPLALKQRVDVWGDTGDALPLMQRVKERFDPKRVLNPGRFVGRI